MKKEKILYVHDENITMTDLHNMLNEFTLHNGQYPDRIHMSSKTLDRYIDMLLSPTIDREKATFRGILIKEIKP